MTDNGYQQGDEKHRLKATTTQPKTTTAIMFDEYKLHRVQTIKKSETMLDQLQRFVIVERYEINAKVYNENNQTQKEATTTTAVTTKTTSTTTTTTTNKQQANNANSEEVYQMERENGG